MASLITSIGSVELTITELRELLSVPAAILPAPIAEPTIEVVETAIERKPVKPRTVKAGDKTETLICKSCNSEFLNVIKRGRKPSRCLSCKSATDEAPIADSKPQDKPQDTPKRKAGKPRKSSGGFDQARFDKWMEIHGDEEMSAKWEARIRWMITDGYVMSDDDRAVYLSILDRERRLTNREAHTLRNTVRKNHKRA